MNLIYLDEITLIKRIFTEEVCMRDELGRLSRKGVSVDLRIESWFPGEILSSRPESRTGKILEFKTEEQSSVLDTVHQFALRKEIYNSYCISDILDFTSRINHWMNGKNSNFLGKKEFEIFIQSEKLHSGIPVCFHLLKKPGQALSLDCTCSTYRQTLVKDGTLIIY